MRNTWTDTLNDQLVRAFLDVEARWKARLPGETDFHNSAFWGDVMGEMKRLSGVTITTSSAQTQISKIRRQIVPKSAGTRNPAVVKQYRDLMRSCTWMIEEDVLIEKVLEQVRGPGGMDDASWTRFADRCVENGLFRHPEDCQARLNHRHHKNAIRGRLSMSPEEKKVETKTSFFNGSGEPIHKPAPPTVAPAPPPSPPMMNEAGAEVEAPEVVLKKIARTVIQSGVFMETHRHFQALRRYLDSTPASRPESVHDAIRYLVVAGIASEEVRQKGRAFVRASQGVFQLSEEPQQSPGGKKVEKPEPPPVEASQPPVQEQPPQTSMLAAARPCSRCIHRVKTLLDDPCRQCGDERVKWVEDVASFPSLRDAVVAQALSYMELIHVFRRADIAVILRQFTNGDPAHADGALTDLLEKMVDKGQLRLERDPENGWMTYHAIKASRA